jgi:PIN domain nuclease of toxin-antitoxin system
MKYLLDSHVFVWLFAKPGLVGDATKSQLKNINSEVFVSLVTLWELELKFSKGRFAYSATMLQDAMSDLGINELTINKGHILASSSTKIEHTDPFDLMLCAQAKAEDMILVTADKALLNSFSNSIDARL